MSRAIQDGQYASLPNGMRLHYASAGERGKPLLIFLHGFPEFWFAWHEQLRAFGDRYFAVHRPEHNRQRAENQLRLYRDLIRQQSILQPMLK